MFSSYTHLKASRSSGMVGIPASHNPSPSSPLTESLSETLLRPDSTAYCRRQTRTQRQQQQVPASLTPTLRKHTIQPQINFRSQNLNPTHNTPQDPSTHAPTYGPTRHINTTKNWSLCARKKWLVVGDSNLSRIPPFQIPDLQMDSFLRATFKHIEGVFSKMNTVTSTETVVLSLGLNNRSQRSQTATSELRRLINTTQKKFPLADIWVLVIKFSRTLPHQEQTNFHDLNNFIGSNLNSIPKLSRSEFSTERDGIRWTHTTASRMLKHWALNLNCEPP